MENNDFTFMAADESGVEKEYRVVFTFTNDEEKGKVYVVYTESTENTDEDRRIYAAYFMHDSKNSMSGPLKSEEDWSKFGDIIDKLMKKEN